MAVQFILGRSGTGKTAYCINAIAEELLSGHAEPLILLVPEQATYQAERSILSDKGIDGYNRLNVLSFDRLGFLLLQKDAARESVSRIGRQMIIQRILRENADKLRIFKSSASQPGLSRQIARTIEEIQQYAKTPDDLDTFLGELQKKHESISTFLKFSDIKLILREYLKFIESDFYDPDVQLSSVCKAIAESDLTKGARLWVDGFAGFTGSELAILAELLKAANDSKIALCLDPVRLDFTNPDQSSFSEADLFNPTQRTFTELLEVIRKVKQPLLEPVLLDNTRRFSCSELAHVERNIFQTDYHRLKSAENIHTVSAPNERAEVQFVARRIERLVREKGYRYRDIAVIASDIESYHHYIRAYFDDYKIPFFIDKRQPLSRHPVVELICSALKIVTEGCAHHDIFAYLKTDLVPISRYDVDVLENYCVAFGISSNDWLDDKPWEFAGSDNEGFDEHRISHIRTSAVSALLELKQTLNEQVTARRFTEAIFSFLDELKVKDTISTWITDASERADFETIDEHQQFYTKLIEVFDELVEIFSGRPMSAGDLYSIVNSAFSQLTLAFIPPTLDQVLVGSVERSRHPDLKAVFLIGTTQKQFPVPISRDSILSDNDRKVAESLDFSLAASVDRALCERQYLAYIAFTRPSEVLYITYPSVDEKGSRVPRSQFIGDLEALFENFHEESVASRQIEMENVFSENELADLLCERLGKDSFSMDPRTSVRERSLLEEICSDKYLGHLGQKVLSSINYRNRAVLEKRTAGDMFDATLKGSATRLGTFASCPYRYFARYVLDLKKRKEFSLEPLDLGNFYHGVLDALVKRMNAENIDFAAVDNDSLIKILNEEIEKFIKANSFLSHFTNRRAYNEFIINSACEVLQDFVPAMCEIIRAGNFRPCVSEIAFGNIKETSEILGNFELELPGNRAISLSGKIDRLDIAEINHEKKVLVFDYKRRDTSFNWSKFYHGLDLQLPIYMLAASEVPDSKYKNIIGAFLLPIEARTETTTFKKLENKKDSFDYKARGIFDGSYFQRLDKNINSGWSKFYNFGVTKGEEQYGFYNSSGSLKPDDFRKVLELAREKIISLAKEILSCKIDVNPYRLNDVSPCKNCDYLSLCRFDWQINEYNSLESLGKIGVLERIGGGNG